MFHINLNKNIPQKYLKISFGGIPDSNSIDILMPYAIFDYMSAFLRSSFAHSMWTMLSPWTIIWLLLSRLQGNKPHRNFAEPSEPCLRNLHQHAPELFRTLQSLPRPSGSNLSEPSGTNLSESSGTYLLNLRQHTPELPKSSGTCLRNLPPEPTPAYAGTLRNLPPEPAPATRTGTHRSLSGLKTPLVYAVGEIYLKN